MSNNLATNFTNHGRTDNYYIKILPLSEQNLIIKSPNGKNLTIAPTKLRKSILSATKNLRTISAMPLCRALLFLQLTQGQEESRERELSIQNQTRI